MYTFSQWQCTCLKCYLYQFLFIWNTQRCRLMDPWGHRTVKAAIMLWSALHRAARRGGVMTGHCRGKCGHGVSVMVFVRTEREREREREREFRMQKVSVADTIWGTKWDGGVESSGAEKTNIRYDWRNTGDFSLGVRDQQRDLLQCVVIISCWQDKKDARGVQWPRVTDSYTL